MSAESGDPADDRSTADAATPDVDGSGTGDTAGDTAPTEGEMSETGTVEATDADDAAAPAPERIVLRPSPLIVLVALVLAVCILPVAGTFAPAWLLYLVPIGMIVWALRTRTVVDHEAVTVRRLARPTIHMPWASIKGFKHVKRAISVVRTDDTEVALPAVRLMHLSAVALVSGGRLRDPAP